MVPGLKLKYIKPDSQNGGTAFLKCKATKRKKKIKK